MAAVAMTMVRLDFWEIRRLLTLFEQMPQEMEDKDLWLKLKHAEERLIKRETPSE
jgi:hypothetical protein